jgi:hypothetical protein
VEAFHLGGEEGGGRLEPHLEALPSLTHLHPYTRCSLTHCVLPLVGVAWPWKTMEVGVAALPSRSPLQILLHSLKSNVDSLLKFAYPLALENSSEGSHCP